MEQLTIILVVGAICALLAYLITEKEDKRLTNALLGFLLGPIGVIVAAINRK